MATMVTLAHPHAVPPQNPSRGLLRLILLVCLVCAIVAASVFLFSTEAGRGLVDREQLKGTGQEVRVWVANHPIAAPAIFLTLYVTCSILALPVWWLQILSGYAWGLYLGTAWSLAGHTCGSVVTLYFARWLGAAWVQAKAGKRMAKFRRLSEKMGHNGLLVVLAARLCHAVPYALSNYLFGITHIRARDVAVGTMIGGLPVVAGWVAIGASPGLLADWRFWAVIIGINVGLLVPLAIRSRLTRRKAKAEAGMGAKATLAEAGI
jgi:uncharacterized membrane protein YdjX (TVP38/TMEM64 family)